MRVSNTCQEFGNGTPESRELGPDLCLNMGPESETGVPLSRRWLSEKYGGVYLDRVVGIFRDGGACRFHVRNSQKMNKKTSPNSLILKEDGRNLKRLGSTLVLGLLQD